MCVCRAYIYEWVVCELTELGRPMANSLVFIMSKSFVYTVLKGRSEWPTCTCRHDHAYFALCTRRDVDQTHFVGQTTGRCSASSPHAHGAVIDYKSKRTCSIEFQSRFRDFCQDFKISGKISRFQARFQRFQDFRQDLRFHARFREDFHRNV